MSWEISIHILDVFSYFVTHIGKVFVQKLCIFEHELVLLKLCQFLFGQSSHPLLIEWLELLSDFSQIVEDVENLVFFFLLLWHYFLSLDLTDSSKFEGLSTFITSFVDVSLRRHVLVVLLFRIEEVFDFRVFIDEFLWDHRGPSLAKLLYNRLEVWNVRHLLASTVRVNVCLTLFHCLLHLLEPFDVVDQSEVSLNPMHTLKLWSRYLR